MEIVARWVIVMRMRLPLLSGISENGYSHNTEAGWLEKRLDTSNALRWQHHKRAKSRSIRLERLSASPPAPAGGAGGSGTIGGQGKGV